MNTSFFNNLGNISAPVSISLFPPGWYTGPRYYTLAPTNDILRSFKNKLIDEEEYKKRYHAEVLDLMDPRRVYRELTGMYGNNCTLLCFEKRGQFCHRRLAADWLSSSLGVTIEEIPEGEFR